MELNHEHTVTLSIASGEPSQLFFLHFNALLSEVQRSAHSTVQWQIDESCVSLTIGIYVIQSKERNIEWRIRKISTGGVESVTVLSDEGNYNDVKQFCEELCRKALSAALSRTVTTFFRRSTLSYFGADLAGEYWLPGLRVAPAIYENPQEQYMMNFERVVVLDYYVTAVDRNQAMAVAAQMESTFLQRLSLLMDIRLEKVSQDAVWVLQEIKEGLQADSVRFTRGFHHSSLAQHQMPEKGKLFPLGEYKGSVSDVFRINAAELVTFPKESRQIFRIAQNVLDRDALTIDACARMYHLSMVLARYSQSAALAYRVAAIDAIVNANKPRFKSITDFIKYYVPAANNIDELIDYLHGSIRSAHFHTGKAPLDNLHSIHFHPLINPWTSVPQTTGFSADLLAKKAIGAWLRETAEKHGKE